MRLTNEFTAKSVSDYLVESFALIVLLEVFYFIW